jgi:uncharacterized membrane protein
MRVYYMHNVCTITPNPVLLVARNCAHYVQSDARGEILMSHYSVWIGVICKLVYLELVSNSQLGLDSRNRRISL